MCNRKRTVLWMGNTESTHQSTWQWQRNQQILPFHKHMQLNFFCAGVHQISEEVSAHLPLCLEVTEDRNIAHSELCFYLYQVQLFPHSSRVMWAEYNTNYHVVIIFCTGSFVLVYRLFSTANNAMTYSSLKAFYVRGKNRI